ncbi:MAG: hypothetical protein A3I05_02870 [Deltaproteobacteria bacterium RIFCSPLOWO2_02_FULL_44_10]|nr:MAG: hypothetical protein A3C46_03530 [Deltaproteobacteria bacterium RIFCSPHIGHO2_02_FULL_44_16]OGQ46555.1 MAG: hypothetical protein A3I05_02870 [Deltaproteobacteria bacterium RIFCSPLOWO2_02_FULL_44_10]
MKKLRFISFVLLFFLSLLSLHVYGETKNSFTLLLLESHHFSDVDALMRALRRSSLIENMTIVREVRDVIELSGTLKQGATGSLRSEVMSAAEGRFSFESEEKKENHHILTLRKLP